MTIITQGIVCDGYDVTFTTVAGVRLTVHFPKTNPTSGEVTALCNLIEQQYLDNLIDTEEKANAEEVLA